MIKKLSEYKGYPDQQTCPLCGTHMYCDESLKKEEKEYYFYCTNNYHYTLMIYADNHSLEHFWFDSSTLEPGTKVGLRTRYDVNELLEKYVLYKIFYKDNIKTEFAKVITPLEAGLFDITAEALLEKINILITFS